MLHTYIQLAPPLARTTRVEACGATPGPLQRNAIQVREASNEHEQRTGFCEIDLGLDVQWALAAIHAIYDLGGILTDEKRSRLDAIFEATNLAGLTRRMTGIQTQLIRIDVAETDALKQEDSRRKAVEASDSVSSTSLPGCYGRIGSVSLLASFDDGACESKSRASDSRGNVRQRFHDVSEVQHEHSDGASWKGDRNHRCWTRYRSRLRAVVFQQWSRDCDQ
ncbi:hypothetical protein [Microbacterium sp. A94]|uniref:hypothetical protein n=1 Tax=Microbacterium sp. A94 TaxID=3450717 RepID=UPI003F43AA99